MLDTGYWMRIQGIGCPLRNALEIDFVAMVEFKQRKKKFQIDLGSSILITVVTSVLRFSVPAANVAGL